MKAIPGHPGYYAKRNGTIFSRLRFHGFGRGRGGEYLPDGWLRQLRPHVMKRRGHLMVSLGRGNQCYVHRLILETFVGPNPLGKECRHRNNNPADNRVSNLRWGTSLQNTNDQRMAGHLVGGERHGMAKLTNAQINNIRPLYPALRQWQIAALFRITQGHVSDIVNRKKRTPSSHAGRGL